MEAVLRDHAAHCGVIGSQVASHSVNLETALNGAIEITRVERNHDIFLEGEEVGGLLVLQKGWAYRYRLLDDGRRHISNFLIDGDIIGPFTVMASHYVATLTDVTITRTSPHQLRALLSRSPDVIAAITDAMTEQYEMLSQRALNLARCTAKERMAQLLLELLERTRRAGLANGLSYPFPATQEIIADCLGLSIVHVNRTVRRLREDGIAVVGSGQVRILDLPGLARLAGADADAAA